MRRIINKLIYKIMSEKIKGLLRHILTFAGSVLVTKGVIDEAMLTEVVGAIITLTGFVLSWLDKIPKEDEWVKQKEGWKKITLIPTLSYYEYRNLNKR